MCDRFFRPSGAWGDSTRFSHPRLAPWATIFRPLRGLRNWVGIVVLGGRSCGFRLEARNRAGRAVRTLYDATRIADNHGVRRGTAGRRPKTAGNGERGAVHHDDRSDCSCFHGTEQPSARSGLRERDPRVTGAQVRWTAARTCGCFSLGLPISPLLIWC